MANYTKNFIEEVIELYHQLPALWKVKSKEYSDRNKKNAAYELMLNKFHEVDPDATRDTIKKKINIWRTTRNKEKKKVEKSKTSGASFADIYVPHLWYYHLFDFLDDDKIVESSITTMTSEHNSSIGSENNCGGMKTHEGINENNMMVELLLDEESLPKTKYPMISKGRKRTSSRSFSSNNSNSSFSNSNSLRYVEDEILQKISKHTNHSPASDEAHFFGQYISSQFRLMQNPTQSLIAQKLINEILFKARQGLLSDSSIIVYS